ncbi:hypothetical protein ACFVUY_37930 [Kitasatospora sp. NPDC058063]|uniref:hypothetical protein n=1 Tax=unclassified Kitasatospora TaxID=2633591 RepID=UPI0036DBA539
MAHYELTYRPPTGRARTETLAGDSVTDAINGNLSVLRDMGLGNAAGLRILRTEIEDLNWEPRYQLSYPSGSGVALNSNGEPIVANERDPRFAVHLRISGALDALGRTGEEKTVVLYGREAQTPGRGRPSIRGAAHVRFGEDLLAQIDQYGGRHGYDRATAARALTAAGLVHTGHQAEYRAFEQPAGLRGALREADEWLGDNKNFAQDTHYPADERVYNGTAYYAYVNATRKALQAARDAFAAEKLQAGQDYAQAEHTEPEGSKALANAWGRTMGIDTTDRILEALQAMLPMDAYFVMDRADLDDPTEDLNS